jgi:hypothetical protein
VTRAKAKAATTPSTAPDPATSGDSLYCDHGRIEDNCEECAYAKAKAAGHPVAPVLYPTDSDPAA